MSRAERKPRSPCIGTCTLDHRQVCVGCQRTLDEITRWPREDDAGRRAILERVAARRARRDGDA